MIGVAISGKAGAGKNAFAHILGKELTRRGLWPTEVTFADQLKRDVLEKYGLTKADPGGREVLVNYSNAIRKKDPLHWVKILARRCDSLIPFGATPVVTDLRYLNEYEWVAEAGLVTVRVDATVVDRIAVLLARGEDTAFAESEHESEVGLDEATFDVRFWNPHGDLGMALLRHAILVADVLDGADDRAA